MSIPTNICENHELVDVAIVVDDDLAVSTLVRYSFENDNNNKADHAGQ